MGLRALLSFLSCGLQVGLLVSCGGLVERGHGNGDGASGDDPGGAATGGSQAAPASSVPPVTSSEPAAPLVGSLTVRMRPPPTAPEIPSMSYVAWETTHNEPLAHGTANVVEIVDEDHATLLQATMRLPAMQGAEVRLTANGCVGSLGPFTIAPQVNLTYEIKLTCSPE